MKVVLFIWGVVALSSGSLIAKEEGHPLLPITLANETADEAAGVGGNNHQDTKSRKVITFNADEVDNISNKSCPSPKVYVMTVAALNEADRFTAGVSDEEWFSKVTMFVLAGISLLLLLVGEYLLKPSVWTVGTITGYLFGFMFMQWLQSLAHFDACFVPLIGAIVLGLIAGGIALYLLKWSVILMGAAIGAVGVLQLERLIVVAFPASENTVLWDYSWCFALGAAVICAVLAWSHQSRYVNPTAAGRHAAQHWSRLAFQTMQITQL